jgi:hypothetical protein
VPLFAVDTVSCITILMFWVKDKKNLLSPVRGMEGKRERSPELFNIFLRVHLSDITLSYTDYLKQDGDKWGAEKKRAVLGFLLFLKAQASDRTLTYPVSTSVHTNRTFQHRSLI